MPRRNVAFQLAMLAIAVVKIILVGTNEIVALPYDSVEYVRYAQLSLGSIGATAPGYPYWLALTACTGLPQRFTIELLYLLACLAIAVIVVKIIGRAMTVLLFGALVFLPSTFFLFDETLSDGFYASLTLLALALSAGALLDDDNKRPAYWIRLAILALVLGWMSITRNEDLLVAGWPLWLGAYCAVTRARVIPLKQAVRVAGLFAAVLLVFTFSVTGAVSTIHAVNDGVFARALPTLPSHLDLLTNLAAIDLEEQPISRVPISRAQRETAYAVSPALRRLRDRVEDLANVYQVASRHAGFPPGQIGAGWIWHVFNSAAFQDLPHGSVKELDELYDTANAELELAFERGQIKKKFVLHPLMGGGVRALVSGLPGSAVRVYNSTFSPTRYQRDQGVEPDLFDAACLRRASLVASSAGEGVVQGWAFVDSPEVSILGADVGVYNSTTDRQEARWYAADAFARPDVEHGLAVQGRNGVAVLGFRVAIRPGLGDATIVRYYFSDGSYTVTPPLAPGSVSRIKQDVTGRYIVQGVDTVASTAQGHRSDIRHRLQNALVWLFAGTGPYVPPAILLFVVGIVVLLRIRSTRRGVADRRLVDLILFAAGMLVQRFMFYVVADATGWEVEARYMASGAVVAVVTGSLLFVHGWVGLRFLWRDASGQLGRAGLAPPA